MATGLQPPSPAFIAGGEDPGGLRRHARERPRRVAVAALGHDGHPRRPKIALRVTRKRGSWPFMVDLTGERGTEKFLSFSSVPG